MAEALVHCVLGKIAETAYNEVLVLYGVRDKVEWAKRELEWVSAFVKDADAKQSKDARVKQWVKDVKEVAYMIEDALDKFFVEMGGGRSKDMLKRVLHTPKALIERHKLRTAIDKIKERMNEIKVNRENYAITSLESNSGGPDWQSTRLVVVPEIDKTEVVGFEDDINNLCKQLCDKSVSRRSVISIVGPGGRGKTTLAIKIYKSSVVGSYFDCRIWITISQEFKNNSDVLKKILKELQENAREVADEVDLIKEVHASLSNKKYLIILDDVWSSDHWTRLEVALPEVHNGSRVLITTRFIDVAKKSDAANKPYELRILSEDESQQLLLKKAFPNQPGNKCPDILLPLTNQFSKKCVGWPLALVVLGGILSLKDLDYNTWNEILLKMDWKSEGRECLDVISTSYEDLPFHLKPCFMYIAVFPEDHEIKASTLIQLWIAEGLIFQDESRKTMEDIAECYLEELIQRCMIQVSKRSWSGRIKYCYTHDSLRELAIRKAKEDNFLLLCSESNANSISGISASMRRIAFHEYGNAKLPMEPVGPSLRSLIDFGGYCASYRNLVRPNHELKMVRVLHIGRDMGWASRQRIYDYKWLEPLITLRYFHCIRDFNLCEVPASFWNNKMLRYVKIDEYPFVMGPSSSAKLENLLTLKSVVARDEWDVKLPHFPRIRKLGILIDKKINWEALAHLMSKLEHLHSLRVYTNLVYTDDEGSKYPCLNPAFRNYKQVYSLYLQFRWPEDVLGGFSQLPSNLVKLTLLWSCLEQDPMPELEKLPSLRVLRLLDDSYKGRQLVCSKGGFKCLQQLKLRDLENLIELKVEEGAMPNLNQLEISDCDRLNVVPGLQCFTNLPELKFYRTCHMTSV